MKTCPNCNSQINEEDNFCIYCGTEIEWWSDTKVCSKCGELIPNEALFCPSCGTKQHVIPKESDVDLYKEVDLREIEQQCGYAENSTDCVAGKLVITPLKLTFEQQSNSGIISILTSIATFGDRINVNIFLKDITAMSIMENGHYLYMATKDDNFHVFCGPTLMNFDKNKNTLKKIAYIIELFRRMYWYYGGYSESGLYLHSHQPLKYWNNAYERIDNISDEKLIKYYNNI